jgi:ubiquinone/menaquinone biosynthesis C-methylase UbiE
MSSLLNSNRQEVFYDHFSGIAAQYARHRPRYPQELFRTLAILAPSRQSAWDCATGNGQAAVGLAEVFEHVTATDASAEQLRHAEPRGNIEYRVARAENSGLKPDSVDVLTVAQAVHWFDIDRFYAEARRVLKPEGIIAVWTYHHATIEPAIDEAFLQWHETIASYWPPERRWVDERYATLPFPFAEEPLSNNSQQFQMTAQWNYKDYVGYLRTWSAVKNYQAQHHTDPVHLLEHQLKTLWQPDEVKEIVWALHIRCGRVTA